MVSTKRNKIRLFWFKQIFFISRMSTQAELFTKDLENFHTEQKHYLDASGNFVGYDATKGLLFYPDRNTLLNPVKLEDTLTFDNKTYFRGPGVVNDPTCTMDDPTLQGGTFIGLSNFNFGHITKPEEFGGTMIQDLGWNTQELKGLKKKIMAWDDSIGRNFNQKEFLMEGELTAPLVEAQDEQGSEDETQWHCKGCSKYFATKASLKRHHERKKSCKEICEKPATTEVALPDKPYIVEWVDQLLTKAISGDSDKPYCRFCEVEFANKTNLNKHLSKSVACDKLAKQELVKIVCS
jgi:hypothetical protein